MGQSIYRIVTPVATRLQFTYVIGFPSKDKDLNLSSFSKFSGIDWMKLWDRSRLTMFGS